MSILKHCFKNPTTLQPLWSYDFCWCHLLFQTTLHNFIHWKKKPVHIVSNILKQKAQMLNFLLRHKCVKHMYYCSYPLSGGERVNQFIFYSPNHRPVLEALRETVSSSQRCLFFLFNVVYGIFPQNFWEAGRSEWKVIQPPVRPPTKLI